MSVVTATILSDGKTMDPTYELLTIDITKEVNRIPYAQLILLDGDAAQRKFPISNTAFFEPGKEIEIKLRYEGVPDSEKTVFKGRVIRHSVAMDEQISTLTLELKDAAVKLTQGRNSRVFLDQTDDQIITKLIQENGLRKGTIAATRPKHAEMVQYYSTDWDFMLLRAQSNGLLVNVDDGVISLPAITTGGPVKHRFEYGLDEIYDFEMTVDGGGQQAGVQSIAWDIKDQKLTQTVTAKNFKLAQGNLDGGKLAKTLGAATATLASFTPLPKDELQAWADGELARNRLALLRGRLSVPGSAAVKPLDSLQIAGVGERFNGAAPITGVRHRVGQHGWLTDIQFGLAADDFGQQQDLNALPAAGLLPAGGGLQIGIVDTFKEDPDKQLRVRVMLPAVGTDKAGVMWARLATPDAGKDRGYFFRPEPGDEVVVGFFNDDPRQAVILGALYSSKNTPPAKVGKLDKDNFQRAIVTRKGTIIQFDDKKAAVSIETPKANKILLDDDAKKIEISDQHGNAITLSSDGIVIKSAKDLKIEASGNAEIKGAKVDIK